MAVRCSLLGHSYDDTEVERQREERGSEVVVTVEEYEVCSRCGKRTVLSENTEVKSLAPEAGVPDGPATATSETTDDADSPALSADETDGTDESTDDFEVPTDEDGEPITDDAEILDDSPEEPAADDRGHGEWPDSDDVGGAASDRASATGDASPTDWPDSTAGDEPSTGDDATAGGAPGDDTRSTDRGPADGSTTADSAASTDRSAPADPSSGIESAGDAPAPGDSPSRDGVPTEFYCPRCPFVATSDRGSLRAGDICPECKKGYLGERER